MADSACTPGLKEQLLRKQAISTTQPARLGMLNGFLTIFHLDRRGNDTGVVEQRDHTPRYFPDEELTYLTITGQRKTFHISFADLRRSPLVLQVHGEVCANTIIDEKKL